MIFKIIEWVEEKEEKGRTGEEKIKDFFAFLTPRQSLYFLQFNEFLYLLQKHINYPITDELDMASNRQIGWSFSHLAPISVKHFIFPGQGQGCTVECHEIK